MKAFIKLVLGVVMFANFTFASSLGDCFDQADVGVTQIICKINDVYEGKRLWVVGENYGDRGFKVYLAYRLSDDLPSLKFTPRGYIYDMDRVPSNRQTYDMLIQYIQEIKDRIGIFE